MRSLPTATLLVTFTLQLVSLATLSSSLQADPIADTHSTSIQIYRPSHRTAQQLIDAVRPLFGNQASFSTDGRSVLFNAPPTERASIEELLPQLDHPPQQLHVELSSRPQSKSVKTYATSSRSLPNTFTVLENETLTLARQQEAQTVNTLHPLWSRVTSIPTRQAFLQVTASIAATQVYLDIHTQSLRHGEWVVLKNSVSGELNQWIPLAGETANTSHARVFSTQAGSASQLYIKVSKLPD